MNGGIDVDGFKEFEITEEKVRKLLPIVEKIWSRKYGIDLKLKYLKVNNVSVCREEGKIPIDIKERTIKNEQNKI